MNEQRVRETVEFVVKELFQSDRVSPEAKVWISNNPDHLLRRLTTLIEVDHQAYVRAQARKI